MDRPKMTASIKMGIVRVDRPGRSEPQQAGQVPSHTLEDPHVDILPRVRAGDSSYYAEWSSTIEPNARNSSTNVETPTSSAIHGSVAPRLAGGDGGVRPHELRARGRGAHVRVHPRRPSGPGRPALPAAPLGGPLWSGPA